MTTATATATDNATANLLPAIVPAPSVNGSDAPAFTMTDEKLRKLIDGLDISADTKAWLASFARLTVRAGREIVRIGKRILGVLFALMRRFPAVTVSLLFVVVVSAVLGAIPVLGPVLQPVSLTVGLGFGFVLGARFDLQNPDLAERVEAFVSELRTVVA